MSFSTSRAVSIGLLLAVPMVTGFNHPVKPAETRSSAVIVELIGLSGQRRSLTTAELAKMPHVEATVSSHNVEGRYRGVLLGELLRLVDRPADATLRGKALATAISVEARDGYKTVFAITEVDTGFSNKVIFLADSRNGVALDSTEGPYRLIVPDEKRPARWAKWVTRIRLIAIE